MSGGWTTEGLRAAALGVGGEDGFDLFGRDAAFLEVFHGRAFEGFDAGDAEADEFRDEFGGEAELVLIGRLAMPLPDEPGVRYLGFLPVAGKAAAMAGAWRLSRAVSVRVRPYSGCSQMTSNRREPSLS